jgi:hypothetical protein
MVAPIIIAVGFSVWFVTVLVVARTVEAVLALAPRARNAYQEISSGRMSARHVWTAAKLFRLLLRGPRAILAAAKAEVVRMWVLGAAAAAAGLMFAGSCFLFTGWYEFELGIFLGAFAAVWLVILWVQLFTATKHQGPGGLWARAKRLPTALMMDNTSAAARRAVFYGLAWFGLAFAAADFLAVGALRHFAF